MGRPARPHVAARLEDLVHRGVGRVLRRRGWAPLVTASTGYADHDGVHVFARVLLAPPSAAGTDRPPRAGKRAVARPPRGWRSLVTVPAPAIDATFEIGSHRRTVTSARGGYVHVELPLVLEPGWHDAVVEVAGRPPVGCRIRAVDPAATHGVVSDIDDTILVTWVPRPLVAAWNTFVLREHARRPVDGMAELLRSLAGEDGFVVYLSTGAWNFASHLERFMAEHGFPPGPMLLTDWGPTTNGWFRSGASHKREMLDRLRREHPTTRWTLVGDDGQRDPQIYAAFAERHPEAVRAVAIRQLTAVQQVLTSGTPTTPAPEEATGASAPALTWVTGSDGHQLGHALRAAGVLA